MNYKNEIVLRGNFGLNRTGRLPVQAGGFREAGADPGTDPVEGKQNA